jgi:hypothetical protein
MNNSDWKNFFIACADILGGGMNMAAYSKSWCAWTTFRRLTEDSGYWACGLPNHSDIYDKNIGDNSVWGQPFYYSEIAHIIIPCRFYWEIISKQGFECGEKIQAIDQLSCRLTEYGIVHRKTDIVLEIKLY